MRPEFTEDIERFPDAPRYLIDMNVEFDGARATIDGVARIQYTNRGSQPLDDIVVMTWPNHGQYLADMSVDSALIAGERVEPIQRSAGVAQRYELAQSLAPGGTLDFSVPFRIESRGTFSQQRPHRFGITSGVLFAPTAYPLVPLLVDGEWQDQNAPLAGDTTNSETAFYRVRISADPGHRVLASGTEIDRDREADGDLAITFVTGPMRDFAFAMGPYVGVSELVDSVSINAWVIPSHESELQLMADIAARQFALLTELIGPYPYTELDIVDVPGGFGGIEYPGLVSVGTVGSFGITRPTVHEVGHQWFYGLIGDDQLEEPWMDEAAASYTEILYFEEISGTGRAAGVLSDYRAELGFHPTPERAIGGAVREYGLGGDYGLFVYLKGALFFDALRAELGDELFFQFLKNYFNEYRYLIASSQNFQQTAEATCACELDDLFDLWVYEGGPIPGP